MKNKCLASLIAFLAVSGTAFAALPIGIEGQEIYKIITEDRDGTLIYPLQYQSKFPNATVFGGASSSRIASPIIVEPQITIAGLFVGGILNTVSVTETLFGISETWDDKDAMYLEATVVAPLEKVF